MREFVFYPTARDKFCQVIHLGDVIIYGGGTQSQSNVAFAIVTRIYDEWNGKHLIAYSPISDNLKCFRSQGNNKSKWSTNIVKIPSEWEYMFADVCKKFNKQEFGNEWPKQEEIDAHFKEKEFDDYQRLNKLGKYAPSPIDRELWKKRLKQLSHKLVEEKPLWKTIFSNELSDDDIKALWVSPEFGRLGDRFIKALKLNFPKCEKTFEDNKEDMNNYLFGLFKEIVYDWTTE